MKMAFIMRGVPGSGKSVVAKYLAGNQGIIHSTDDLRMINGEYVFDPVRNQQQHDQNFANFCQSLDLGVDVVICDNTNITKRDYQRYIDAANNAGYLVVMVVMPHPNLETAANRNSHGVSLEVIRSMFERWEP
jgi:tRNA uridine 5-carbamoylmethylation protein Kti12